LENREEVEVERKKAKGKSEETKPIVLDSCSFGPAQGRLHRNDMAGSRVNGN